MSRTPSSVLINYHEMYGIDPHMGCPMPLWVTVIPPLVAWNPHFVYAQLKDCIWSKGTSNSRVLAEDGEVMALGTDIGQLIPHFGPANNLWLMALHTFCSSSISLFGASSVVAEGNRPVATSSNVIYNLNLNCGSPVAYPLGVVLSKNTVLAGMSVSDFILGYFTMGFVMTVTGALGSLFDNVGKAIGQDYMSTVGAMPDLKEAVEFFGGTTFGWFIGSPVGFSVPGAPLGDMSPYVKGEMLLMDLFNGVNGGVGRASQDTDRAVEEYYQNANILSFP